MRCVLLKHDLNLSKPYPSSDFTVTIWVWKTFKNCLRNIKQNDSVYWTSWSLVFSCCVLDVSSLRERTKTNWTVQQILVVVFTGVPHNKHSCKSHYCAVVWKCQYCTSVFICWSSCWSKWPWKMKFISLNLPYLHFRYKQSYKAKYSQLCCCKNWLLQLYLNWWSWDCFLTCMFR